MYGTDPTQYPLSYVDHASFFGSHTAARARPCQYRSGIRNRSVLPGRSIKLIMSCSAVLGIFHTDHTNHTDHLSDACNLSTQEEERATAVHKSNSSTGCIAMPHASRITPISSYGALRTHTLSPPLPRQATRAASRGPMFLFLFLFPGFVLAVLVVGVSDT